MKPFTKDQNRRVKIARREFLDARKKYKLMVRGIRAENRKSYKVPLPEKGIDKPWLLKILSTLARVRIVVMKE
jgi:hypothetical protein